MFKFELGFYQTEMDIWNVLRNFERFEHKSEIRLHLLFSKMLKWRSNFCRSLHPQLLFNKNGNQIAIRKVFQSAYFF